MNPGEVCTAQVSVGGTEVGSESSIINSLALSGLGNSLLIIIIIGVGALLVGALALFGALQLRHRQQLSDELQNSAAPRPRSAVRGALLSLLCLAGAGVILAQILQPTPAAAVQVQYSDGCKLIEISEVTPNAAAQTLLPGDEVAVMSAVITNISSFPLEVSIDSAFGPGSPLEHVTQLSTLLNGAATASLRLAPGAHAISVVQLKLSEQAENSIQQVTAPISLTVTAVQS